MSSINETILKQIIEGKSVKEIMALLDMNRSTLLANLKAMKNQGYHFEPSYFDNGKIILKIADCTPNKVPFQLGITGEQFRFLAISDTHLGTIYDRLDLLHAIYNYARQNGIHTVFHVGDIIDGDCNTTGKHLLHETYQEQVSYFFHQYPKTTDVNTFLLCGNHESWLQTKYGFDLAEAIKNRRLDLVPLGYGIAPVKLNQYYILLYHPIDRFHTGEYYNKLRIKYKPIMILHGHSHKSLYERGARKLFVPSLCNMKNDVAGWNIGAWEVTIRFQNKKLKEIIPTPLHFETKITRGKSKVIKYQDN